MFQFERDPNRRALETEVRSKLEEIYNTLEPDQSKERDRNNVSFVSIEDAIKELLEMGVKG